MPDMFGGLSLTEFGRLFGAQPPGPSPSHQDGPCHCPGCVQQRMAAEERQAKLTAVGASPRLIDAVGLLPDWRQHFFAERYTRTAASGGDTQAVLYAFGLDGEE